MAIYKQSVSLNSRWQEFEHTASFANSWPDIVEARKTLSSLVRTDNPNKLVSSSDRSVNHKCLLSTIAIKRKLLTMLY